MVHITTILVEWVVILFTLMCILISGDDLQHAVIPAFIAMLDGALLYLVCNAGQAAMNAVRGCRI